MWALGILKTEVSPQNGCQRVTASCLMGDIYSVCIVGAGAKHKFLAFSSVLWWRQLFLLNASLMMERLFPCVVFFNAFQNLWKKSIFLRHQHTTFKCFSAVWNVIVCCTPQGSDSLHGTMMPICFFPKRFPKSQSWFFLTSLEKITFWVYSSHL